jgi:preprotein translocase subunit SecG
VFHLTLLILLATSLSISNLVLHYQTISKGYSDTKMEQTSPKIFQETITEYPMSFFIAMFAILFSVFVLTLFSFHTYILSENLTTQEKLNHKYDKFPISPFSYGSVTSNWCKVICCPKKRTETRLSYPLYLKTNHPEQFE